MSYWRTVYKYFRSQGVPKKVLDMFCINPEEAAQITSIIEATKPQTILEIGTFIGLSTGVIALARAPESTLVCIDANFPVGVFVGDYADEINFPQIKFPETRKALTFVRQMLQHFGQEQKTVILEGLFSHLTDWAREQISALGGNPEQAPIIGEEIGAYAPYDLVFIDGDHHADAVYRDLTLIAPYLAERSIVVLHDVIGYWGEQVLAGIAQFIQGHPDFSLKTDYRLGFLSRDAEKAWLVPQKPPSIVKRVAAKQYVPRGKRKLKSLVKSRVSLKI